MARFFIIAVFAITIVGIAQWDRLGCCPDEAEIAITEEDLAVQIFELDRVLVDEDERPDAGLRERDGGGRADAARSDEQHAERREGTVRRSTHRG